MENLPELISRVLAGRGRSVSAFASRIGVNRQTVARWNASMPAAATLRRVADELDVEYSVALSAALVSTGYVNSPADLLAGQPVHVVTTCEGSYGERGEVSVAGVFTDAQRAADFTRVVDAISDNTDVDGTTVAVDEAQTPATVRVYTTTWSSRSDQIRETESLARERPARLIDRDVTDVEASELADTEQVIKLTVDSVAPGAGRSKLVDVLERFRAEGRLLPPGEDPRAYGGPSGLLMAAALEFGLAEGSSIPGPGHVQVAVCDPQPGDIGVVNDSTYVVIDDEQCMGRDGLVAIAHVEALDGFQGWRRHPVGNGAPCDEERVSPGTAPLQAWRNFAEKLDGRQWSPYRWSSDERVAVPRVRRFIVDS